MKYRVSTLKLLAKVNLIIEELVKLNNDNPYNMYLNITDEFGNELLGDNFVANINIQFNEIEYKDDMLDLFRNMKGLEPKKQSDFRIIQNKKQELLTLFETYKCGKCALNLYEKGSNIEFLVSLNGFEQFNNIEVSCPNVNDEILTIDNYYYIFDIRNSKKEYLKYEKLLEIKKKENTTEYEFIFSNIEEPFVTFTRGYASCKKIMHRLDYIVFSKDIDIFKTNSLKLITRVLENSDGDLNKQYLEIAEKIIKY